MTAANTISLVIDEKAHSYAKIYASLLKEEFQRKRSYASIVALYALINTLEKTDNEIQKSMTLFRNPVLNEQFEISDVYVNNWHIDVRVITGGDAFLVPKSHFDNDLQPDFYAVVKVDKNLLSAELLGFADTALLDKQPFDYNYYSVSLNALISYDEFLIKVNNTKLTTFSEQEHEFFKESYLSLLDEELDIQTKSRLLRHLFECSVCRTEFCCFTGFEMVSCNMGKYPDLLEDQTLNIIGAQDADKEKYIGKEETIYIGDDDISSGISDTAPEEDNASQTQDNTEETLDVTDETTEETVSDILDELFNIEEDFVEPDVKEEKEMTVPTPTVSDSGDLEIFEDNSTDEITQTIEESAPLELIDENTGLDETPELEMLDENIPGLTSAIDDEVVLIDSTETVENNELEFHDDNNNELEIIEDSASIVSGEIPSGDNVQKVIVDYDEFGEPIYSYITNISQEDSEEEKPDIEPIDDDILNEEFETYPMNEDTTEELLAINNGAARPIEYIQNDDDNIQENQQISENLEYVEKDTDDVMNEQNSESDTENMNFEEYKDSDEDEQAEEFVQYKDDDIISSDDENEELMQVDSSEYEEENSDAIEQNEEYPDETEDETEDSEEDDEYEGEYEDEEVEIPDENVAKPVKSKNLVILSLLIVFVLIASGAGAFFFLKKQGSNTAIVAQNDNNVSAPVETDSQQVNDMFESTEDGGIEIPAGGNEQNAQLPVVPPKDTVASENIDIPPLTEQDLLNNQNKTPNDVSASLANAFSPNANRVTLRAVNWLCSPQLFTDNAFKAYLQNLDNIVKLNLRKNILDVSEQPQNNTVTVKMAVENNGNLNRIAVSESSGSEQIDNIVLQSINESFEGEKSQILNDSPQKADMYYLKLVIKL